MEGIGEDGADGFPFKLQAPSSEAATCDIPIFWA